MDNIPLVVKTDFLKLAEKLILKNRLKPTLDLLDALDGASTEQIEAITAGIKASKEIKS